MQVTELLVEVDFGVLTPLPMWISEDGEVLVMDSIEKLEKLSGVKVCYLSLSLSHYFSQLINFVSSRINASNHSQCELIISLHSFVIYKMSLQVPF